MKKQELYNKVIAYFQEAMPVAETELITITHSSY